MHRVDDFRVTAGEHLRLKAEIPLSGAAGAEIFAFRSKATSSRYIKSLHDFIEVLPAPLKDNRKPR
jgi:hypothetical protein